MDMKTMTDMMADSDTMMPMDHDVMQACMEACMACEQACTMAADMESGAEMSMCRSMCYGSGRRAFRRSSR